jgi:hypothetical protein
MKIKLLEKLTHIQTKQWNFENFSQKIFRRVT